MYTLVLTIHLFACVLLILLVLMQSGKGSAAGLFGSSGGGDNIFSSPTAFNLLNRMTAVVALVLFVTSLSLTYLSDKRGAVSVVDRVSIPVSDASKK